MDDAIKIQIGKRKFKVRSQTLADSMKETRLTVYAVEHPMDDIDDQSVAMGFYPKMVSCSKGDVPDLAEFLTLSAEDLGPWYDAVVKKNPKSFDFSSLVPDNPDDPAAVEDADKKKPNKES